MTREANEIKAALASRFAGASKTVDRNRDHLYQADFDIQEPITLMFNMIQGVQRPWMQNLFWRIPNEYDRAISHREPSSTSDGA